MKFVYPIFNWLMYYRFLLKKKKKESGPIKRLHFLTNAVPAPNGGIGGPSTSLSMMQEVIGNRFLEMDVKYSFFRTVHYRGKRVDNYSILGGISWVYDLVKDEKETLYATHDCATAAGLSIAGKRYIYTSHTQGPIVEEMEHFGMNIRPLMKKLIYAIEKRAYRNALYVQFPSHGAREAFVACDNKANGITFTPGPIVYNTIYAKLRAERLRPLKREEGTITFLSIGNITRQKGYDRHASFLREYLKYNTNKVRYIVRGTGPLEREFVASMRELELECPHFSFIHITKRISGEKMEYLKEISDIYLMLHRTSIFDMATLEMFWHGKTAVLSKLGGNLEFNKEKNIILVDENAYHAAALELSRADVEDLGRRCRDVYDSYFSNQQFLSSYETLIKGIVQNG